MRSRVRFLPWARKAFISAKTGRGVSELLEAAVASREARRRRIATPDLNGALKRALQAHTPPLVHNRRVKLFYATQAEVDPPTFILFVNDPKIIHFSYRRYLEKAIRQVEDFDGTAIKLVFRSRSEDDSAP